MTFALQPSRRKKVTVPQPRPDTLFFIEGSAELLDAIEQLWIKQVRYHASVSTYFREEFKGMTFAKRMKELRAKGGRSRLRVVIARTKNTRIVGYAIASITKSGIAEIDSLFVEKPYRNRGIGGRLASLALEWCARCRPIATTVNVAIGNEPAISFYRHLGFFPRTIALLKKNRPAGT